MPVIKDAGDLNIAGLAKKIGDLAARTRQNKVTPDELSGGTFTITNYGSAGTLMDTPIINQPQVAILGTGALVKRPVVIKDSSLGEVIAVRDMMYLSMSYDHRLVDGADAARFLSHGQGSARRGRLRVRAGRLTRTLCHEVAAGRRVRLPGYGAAGPAGRSGPRGGPAGPARAGRRHRVPLGSGRLRDRPSRPRRRRRGGEPVWGRGRRPALDPVPAAGAAQLAGQPDRHPGGGPGRSSGCRRRSGADPGQRDRGVRDPAQRKAAHRGVARRRRTSWPGWWWTGSRRRIRPSRLASGW